MSFSLQHPGINMFNTRKSNILSKMRYKQFEVYLKKKLELEAGSSNHD